MPEPLHALLRRQLKRCFGSVEEFPPALEPFVDAVNAAYRQADADRLMLERSMELSSDELSQANANLQKAILDLQAAHDGMERRVVERTRELDAANANLNQAQKMEAIGQLAGGVAHDFNNLLMVILGNCDLLLREAAPDDPARDGLSEIKKAGNNAASLTRQLLEFSRKQIIEPRVLDLNAVIGETMKMLKRLVGEHITVEARLAPRLGLVKVDPGQVNQVLVNLAVNARDAMPSGGLLTIETADTDAGQVMLSVSDTGTGITPEVQGRLFEPFFTTKEQGKGTGLGLASVYGIVKQNDGNIWVDSEIGRGTTFNICLPRVASAVDEPAAAETVENTTAAETILLAEDNDGVRALISKVLAGMGYSVLIAENGERALEISQAHQGSIELLVTDVVMPGMSGPSLASQLTAERSGTRVLFISGYASESVIKQDVLASGAAFLPKPFSADVLARKVQDVLAGGAATEPLSR